MPELPVIDPVRFLKKPYMTSQEVENLINSHFKFRYVKYYVFNELYQDWITQRAYYKRGLLVADFIEDVSPQLQKFYNTEHVKFKYFHK